MVVIFYLALHCMCWRLMKLLEYIVFILITVFLCYIFCCLFYFVIIRRNQNQKVRVHQKVHTSQETRSSNGSEMSVSSRESSEGTGSSDSSGSVNCPRCGEPFDDDFEFMVHYKGEHAHLRR